MLKNSSMLDIDKPTVLRRVQGHRTARYPLKRDRPSTTAAFVECHLIPIQEAPGKTISCLWEPNDARLTDTSSDLPAYRVPLAPLMLTLVRCCSPRIAPWPGEVECNHFLNVGSRRSHRRSHPPATGGPMSEFRGGAC